MIIRARVKTGKRENRLIKSEVWEIHLRARPVKGEANKELIRFLKSAGYEARILSGFKSRDKVLEVTPKG